MWQGAVLFHMAVGLHSDFWRSLAVRLVVELLEEEEEHDRMHTYPPHEGPWIVAVYEKQLECVHHNPDKLSLKNWTENLVYHQT